MTKRIPLGNMCVYKIDMLSSQCCDEIEYIDISSVDNIQKKIVSSQIIPIVDAPSRAKQLINKGDVLVSTVRPNLNAVAIVDRETDNTLVASTGYCILRTENEIHQKYIYYFCQSPYFVEDMVKQATGASYPAVSSNIVKSSLIPDYDEREKKKIVISLDKVSILIDDRKNQLSKLDELVKSRFVEMFGLPVSNSKNWNTEKMNDIAPAVNYSGDFEETIWLLNLDMVEAQTGRIIDYLYVSKGETGTSTCTFDTSNVLYSKLRPYLNKVVIPDRCGYATSEMIPLKPNPSKLERTYLAFMLRSDEFVNMINKKVSGAKMPRVSMGDFRGFDVPLPPMELQKQFAIFVEQTDKLKVEVKESLEKLETLKKALMQKYFG